MLKFDVLVENWYGQLETAKCLSNIVCDSNNRILDRGRAWCQSLGVPFYRFSPQLKEPIEMDEKDLTKLINMMWDTMAYFYEKREEVKILADILKN